MRPRIACRAVLFPAPLGPMRPRMRPSSTRRSMPSRAMVEPKTLRNPRASMQATSGRLLSSRGVEQVFRRQTQPLNGRVDARPLFLEKLLALGVHQQIARAGVDVHASPPPLLHELLVDQ